MLGERLRQARLAAGLSLQSLADKLEQPITRQALSRYETGASQPGPTRIVELATALNVSTSSLLTESAVRIRWVAYRKLARLSKSRQEQLTALAIQRLEGELRLRELFHLGQKHDLPGPIEVHNLSHCDYAAATLRMRWNLGDRPVDGLITLIEEHGVAVVSLPEALGFDGLSGWANDTPVLVLNRGMPPDRLRLNAAHELGHLVMERTGDAKQDEQFAFRFAASFLVPPDAARRELGTRRRGLDLTELGLLKERWGLSMQGWIRRARDLEIIGNDHYRELNVGFRRTGWHRTEPFTYEGRESPALYRRLVRRALVERMITSEDADRLYPGVSGSTAEAWVPSASLRDLARRPRVERHLMLRDAQVAVDPSDTEVWDTTLADQVH